MTDPDMQDLIEQEFEKRFAQRVETAFTWMVMEGADKEDVKEDGPIAAHFVLNGIAYFIGRPTMNLSYGFELEIGALIYENPPFSPEAIESMLEPVVTRIPLEEGILYIENDESGVWVICRFEDVDFADDTSFDNRVRQLVSLAEAAHGAVH